METKEEDNFEKVLTAIGILRKVTKFVKCAPFVYALIYLGVMIFYVELSIEADAVLDELFYVSPIVCFAFIRLSYYLKLCNWYRLQCCLPMLPTCVVLIDENVYEFGMEIAAVNFATITLIILLSLVNAYFVFIKPTK